MSINNKPGFNSNILFPIQIEEENKDPKFVNMLLKKTKSLVLSNLNYNKFMKKYLMMTQELSFKLPEITSYPILKNEHMIPINRQTYSSKTGSIMKDSQENARFLHKNCNESCQTSVFNGENDPNKDINKSKISQLKTSLNGRNNDQKNHTLPNFFSHRNSVSNKKLLFENETRMKNVIKKYLKGNNVEFSSTSKISNSPEIELLKDLDFSRNLYLAKDYKTLMLDLLCDFEFGIQIFDYENLVKNLYNEKSIFFDQEKKNECEKTLKKMINKLIQGTNENLTYELKKSYDIVDMQKLELKISSIELEIIQKKNFDENILDDLNNENDKDLNSDISPNAKNHKIYIPFSIMPVFYYSSLDSFYIFLSKIISINTTKISEESELKDQMENVSDKNEDEIKINFETVRKVLETFKDFIFNNECYNKDFINSKNLEWITENKEFTIKINPPKIEFYLLDNSFYISKILSKDILIFLLYKSFINWDFFVLNYLARFKIFRENLNDRFYKKIKNMKKSIKITSDNYDNQSLHVNDFKRDYIRINLDDVIVDSELKTNCTISFLFTNKLGETYYFKFDSYRLKVILNLNLLHKKKKHHFKFEKEATKLCKEEEFKFTMDQLIKLEKLKKFYDLKGYLKRMVLFHFDKDKLKAFKDDIENYKIDFDLRYFENLDDNFFKFLVKTSNEIDHVAIESADTEEEKLLDYILINPTLFWFENNEFICREIPSNTLRKFRKIEIYDWFKELSKIIPNIIKNYTSPEKKNKDYENSYFNQGENSNISPTRDIIKRLPTNLGIKKNSLGRFSIKDNNFELKKKITSMNIYPKN